MISCCPKFGYEITGSTVVHKVIWLGCFETSYLLTLNPMSDLGSDNIQKMTKLRFCRLIDKYDFKRPEIDIA